jgi:hypothetical protein
MTYLKTMLIIFPLLVGYATIIERVVMWYWHWLFDGMDKEERYFYIRFCKW